MKVLCLHGSYGSASVSQTLEHKAFQFRGEPSFLCRVQNFQAQLRPFIDAVEQPGSVEFKWINGGHAAVPPAGFDNYFGAPPLYRFVDFDGITGLDDMLSKIRHLPKGATPEDTMRRLVGEQQPFTARAVKCTLDRLFKVLEDDPEIDGILGYSEGAVVAATLIMEESRRCKENGRPRQIKYGIFFAGWPPVRFEEDSVQCLLADECEHIIDVPTCHIVGCNDPYLPGALALFSMCEEDTATLFDHGKGHTVPRDTRTIEELASTLKEAWNKDGICI